MKRRSPSLLSCLSALLRFRACCSSRQAPHAAEGSARSASSKGAPRSRESRAFHAGALKSLRHGDQRNPTLLHPCYDSPRSTAFRRVNVYDTTIPVLNLLLHSRLSRFRFKSIAMCMIMNVRFLHSLSSFLRIVCNQ
ncbi:hypothetical protein C8R43DRAFT_549673 [Mycena crocata]|nr:hypothetical protein C8R43DRAFT_549673 [Mycena crocata]